ncbi:hypothetical protein AABB24_009482 [Solanum stoloniferum]|uniref:Integrase catalytic domain-containing protein n=1 Tax=Solanum stoloniferum TaxID=62892 RepID=A0ABD2UJQ1_9SOLN
MFDLVHGDVWGPYKMPTHDDNRFFLTLVDDHTKIVWVYLLKLKSDVHVVLKNFLQFVKTQFETDVKYFQSDNGTELFNSTCKVLFTNAGIIYQSSYAYTPQQNGVVERKHRQILEVARSIMFQGSFPTRFWGHCVQSVVYLINRTPTSALGGKSPLEVFLGKKPNLQHLRVLGYLCYASNTSPTRDKFGVRAVKSVGYSTTQKGYIFFYLTNKLFFVSRNVHFVETIFPFYSNPPLEVNHHQLQHPGECFVVADPFVVISREPTEVILEDSSTSSLSTPTSLPISSNQEPVVIPQDTAAPFVKSPRKSKRVVKTPTWLHDFVHKTIQQSSSCQYPMSNYMSYANLYEPYLQALCNISTIKEPESYAEVIQHPKWVQVMDQELLALADNKTWSLALLSADKKAIGCKWVLRSNTIIRTMLIDTRLGSWLKVTLNKRA